QEKYPYNTQDWKDWKDGKAVASLAGEFAGYADKALIEKGDIGVALEAAEMSIEFSPKLVWTRVNLAHAQMFLGDTERARTEYLSHCGTKLEVKGLLWEEAVLQDFSKLRTKDRWDKLMDEVEAKFKAHDCLPNVDKARTEASAKAQ